MKHGLARWSFDLTKKEASKYTTRTNFYKGNPNAYDSALKHGWLNDICSHMVFSHISWNKEMARKEALKYKTRSEFQTKGNKAYTASKNHRWLDDLCGHMPKHALGFENNVIYIWKATNKDFNSKQVYKIGITSERLDIGRIKKVSKASGFDYEIIVWSKVNCPATDIEKRLHSLGENPDFNGFDGSTEFRALSDEELSRAKIIIATSAVIDLKVA